MGAARRGVDAAPARPGARRRGRAAMTTYFHGGSPSLLVGGSLLPAEATGANPREDHLRDPEFVFVTPEREYACLYASLYPDRIGTIYEVDPVGLQPEGVLPWERRASAARVV